VEPRTESRWKQREERESASTRLCRAHGGFRHGKSGYEITEDDQPAAAFLFERIARLQTMATVPMIDVGACAKWLKV
jgi:hypothetical protein